MEILLKKNQARYALYLNKQATRTKPKAKPEYKCYFLSIAFKKHALFETMEHHLFEVSVSRNPNL